MGLERKEKCSRKPFSGICGPIPPLERVQATHTES